MSSNPCAAPASYFMERPEKERILSIASNQKVIQWLVLVSLLTPVLPPIILFTFVLGLVFFFRLASDMYGAVMAFLLTILTVVPLAGLVVVYIMDRDATRILKAHGFHVGLMGANLKKVRFWATYPRHRILPYIFRTTDKPVCS